MTASPEPGRMRRRWTQLARLGFWFFLLKGLLWLVVPVAALWLGWGPR